MPQYIDDVTKDDVKKIAEKAKQRRLDNQASGSSETELHIPYPCPEHRHFRCIDCGTVICGGEHDSEPFISENRHVRHCGTCRDRRGFEPYTPFWATE